MPSKTASPKQSFGDAWEISVDEQVPFDAEAPELESGTDHDLLSNDQDENEVGFDETNSKNDDSESEASSPGIAIKDEEDEDLVALIDVQEASRKLQRAIGNLQYTLMAGQGQETDEETSHL